MEYPIVADVDADGHAEIVLTSNRKGIPGKGIKVFEAAKGGWAPTRPIWNQHSYHVTNINDDGSIPRVERHSWLEHNTYRLNRFLDRDALDSADLTVSLLRPVDNGAGEPMDVTVRIGNGGGLATDAGVAVTLYDGGPDAGGVVLAEQVLPALESGEYVDLTFTEQKTPASGQFRVQVDPDEQVAECDESNNFQQKPATAAAVLGEVTVGTDSAEYGPDVPVTIAAQGTNLGSFRSEFEVTLTVEDDDGAVVAELGRFHLGELAAGAAASVEAVWNTGGYLTGGYRVRAHLLDGDGDVLDEAVTAFRIVHDTSAVPTADLRTATDRAIYHTTDRVVLENLIRNLTANTILEAPEVTMTVKAPDGSVWPRMTLPLSTLMPGGERRAFEQLTLEGASQGQYRVTASLRDGDGPVLASDVAAFRVVSDPEKALTGTVEIEFGSLYQGETQTCHSSVANNGRAALDGVQVRQLILSLENDEPILANPSEADLEAGAESELSYVFATTPMPIGPGACVLQAKTDGEWRTLAYAAFEVTEPPIRIDTRLEAGDWGRLLVLLDDGNTATGRTNDPHGPKERATLAAQRAYLEELLTLAGWSYTIVTDPDAFTRELRSRGYQVYLLQSEQVKLPESVQKELREAVFRGEGLVVAGDHDERLHNVDDALGIRFRGKVSHTDGLELSDDALAPAGQVFFGDDRQALRLRAQETDVIGRLLLGGQPAVTRNAYGEGRSVLVGIDLLAEAAQEESSEPLLGQLLLGALADVHPETLTPVAGTVYPVRVTLSNEGIPTPGQLSVAIPEGASVVDPSGGIEKDGSVLWSFDLAEAEQESFNLWLRLPDEPGEIDLMGYVRTGTAPELADYGEVTFRLEIKPAASLDQANERFELLRGELGRDPVIKKVGRYLEDAESAYDADDPRGALRSLVKTTDELLEARQDGLIDLRLHIDRAIRTIGSKVDE